MEYRSRSKTSVISGCGMLIRGVVKFSARSCPGINFRKVGNYATRTTNTSGSTSSAVEEMQSRGSESEDEDQGAYRCLTLTVRLTCETRVSRVFVR